MKETDFIKRNKEHWKAMEAVFSKKTKNDNDLYELYIKSVSDLSFAQTFYKNRTVRVFLNNLSQKVFFKIYKSISVEKWKSFKQFWKEDLPATIWNCRKSMYLSLSLFVIAFIIGIISSFGDKNFASQILGADYVATTLENIKKGDPMAIYKSSSTGVMATQITLNNIMVSLFVYIQGIFWGVGTFFIMLYNGIMLGVFETFLYQQGVLKDSMLVVWLHGTIEISSIIIAGGAGFELAKGLLLPGTYSRLESLRRSAIFSIKIMMGTIPLFVIAGFIEGYITRHTEIHWGVRLFLILFSLIFMVFNYVYRPYKMRKKKIEDIEVKASIPYKIEWTKVKNAYTLFYESGLIFFKNLKKILLWNALAALIWLSFSYSNSNDLYNLELFPIRQYLKEIPTFTFALILACILFVYNQLVITNKIHNYTYSPLYLSVSSLLPIAVFIYVFFGGLQTYIFYSIFIVFISYWLINSYFILDKKEDTIKVDKFSFQGFFSAFGAFVLLNITFTCFIYIFDKLIWEYLEMIISIHLSSIDKEILNYINYVKQFILSWAMFVFIQLFFIMASLYYGVLIEITQSIDLKTRLSKWQM